MKKVVIIGGGIAGLTAGILLQRAGFQTEIYEKNPLPGGQCTGWKRDGYMIDNCIHWLTGTKPGSSLHELWKEIGALGAGIEVHQKEMFFSSNLDGQTLTFWRDKERRKSAGLEHSVLTSGDTIQELFPTYSRLSLTHKDGFQEPLAFLADGETAQGDPANKLTVKFSGYKTGIFAYDAESGRYLVSEGSKPYLDGNTGEQVSVKNVLVLHTDVQAIKGDDKGRQSLRTTGTGEGQFFCDGTVQDIIWSKADHASPMSYTTADGQPLRLGVGTSYINIIGSSSTVTVE